MTRNQLKTLWEEWLEALVMFVVLVPVGFAVWALPVFAVYVSMNPWSIHNHGLQMVFRGILISLIPALVVWICCCLRHNKH
jgi:hypothetical protein